MFDDCTNIFQGYGSVDSILEDCEQIGTDLRKSIASWTSGNAKEIEGALAGQVEDGALSLRHLELASEGKPKDYLVSQPELLSDTVQLKEYQLLGVNWLNLLYRENLSCILADEMGSYFPLVAAADLTCCSQASARRFRLLASSHI